MWKTIHYVALAYPEKPTPEEKQDYKNFFVNLYKVIPCYGCAVNYQKNIEIVPIDDYLDNNLSLFKWTFIIHNMVNVETGKAEITFDEAMSFYLGAAQPEKRVLWKLNLVLILLIAVAISVTIWRKKRAK